MHKRFWFRLAGLLVLGACAGCATGPGKGSSKGAVPHEGQLRERVAAFQAAWAKRDKDAIIKIILPGDCRKTFTPRVVDMLKKPTDVANWRILEIRNSYVPPPFADANKVKTMAVVPLYVQIRNPDGTLRVLEGCTDYWALYRGKWYWYWNEVATP